MNKLIQKILARKRNMVIVGILLAVILGTVSYILTDISRNVKRMASPDVAIYFPDYPPVNMVGKDPALVKRGDYLVKAGDCIACHTNSPERGTPFAGGLPMQTPFGIIYTPNITPDKETGIGRWTDDQFIKAMREGISPQGKHYYPAFPYPYFNKVTTEDLKAIKAYLDSIPPIHQQNRANKMVFPFNWRFLQSGWRLLFFNPAGSYKPDPAQSAEWNRGAYLVEGLGHCAMCHTPSYHIFSEKLSLGAPIRKYNLTGAQVQGYLAPNITHTNLGAISNEEMLQIFMEDRKLGGGNVQGPMLEANHDSLRYLARADLLAISTYLKSVQSKLPPQPQLGESMTGKPIYDSYCSGCHATGAGGAIRVGDAASWGPLLRSGIEKVYAAAISGAGAMPPRGTCTNCSDRDIKNAVDYMISVSLYGSKETAVSANRPVPLSIDDGKHIYDENCSVCHASGFKNAPKPGDKEAWKPIIDKGFLNAYSNVVEGRKGHPSRGACPQCTDNELLAAVKYMMQQSATDKNYHLW